MRGKLWILNELCYIVLKLNVDPRRCECGHRPVPFWLKARLSGSACPELRRRRIHSYLPQLDFVTAVLSKFASKKELFKLEVLGAQLRNEYEKYVLRAPRTLRSTCHSMQGRNDGTQRYTTERNCIERMRKYVIAWTFEFLSGARLLFLRYTNRDNVNPKEK